MSKPRIVILGAGYAGLMTAAKLQKSVGLNEADIKIVNRNGYHYETTWLHEASAGTLPDTRALYDITGVLDKNKIQFIQGTVEKIVAKENRVLLEGGEMSYDYLVVALGSEPETFGIKGMKENAFFIDSIHSARKIREHIEKQFATYSLEEEKDEKRLTIVVGGAGFTGIEFVGELANRIPRLCEEFHISREKVKIICLEAAPTILPGFDSDLIQYAINRLEEKGVTFMTGTAVKEVTPDGVIAGKDENTLFEIPAGTVVWAAGVRGNSVVEKSGFETLRARVKVDSDLRAPGFDNVFVIGDSALIINEETNRPYPPTAQIAMQQGKVCAHNLLALIRGEKRKLKAFKPDIKGTVCSLGEHDAIGIVFGKKLKGTAASIMKKVIDNRALFMIGGLSLMLRKGKFKVV